MTDDQNPSADPDEIDDDLAPELDPDDLDSDDNDSDDNDSDDNEALDPDGFDGQLLAEIGEDGLTYEASDWAGESRALLDALLTSEGVTHMWQGTQLIVPLAAEAQVEGLMDEVLATATPALDGKRDKVVYEVGAWSASLQTSLAESLVVADIPYEWSESGDLMVYADDEDRVDEILESMPDPDDAELAETDGLAVQEVLGQLFLASSTLAKSPDDADAVIALVDHTQRLESIAVPFGFEAPVWHTLVAKVGSLRDALEEPEVEDSEEDPLADLAVELPDTDTDTDTDDGDDDDDVDPVVDEVDDETVDEVDDDDTDTADELSDDELRARAVEVRDLLRTYV